MQSEVLTEAARDVIAERERQQAVEGWTTDHDDIHDNGQIADAAAVYAASRLVFKEVHNAPYRIYTQLWPWDAKWWKPKDRRSDLVRAGALILAEIERLDRLKLKDTAHG